MCLTWNGTPFPAVTRVTPILNNFPSATPGTASSDSTEIPIPRVRALVIPSAFILEWEDALCPVSCLALCCCCLHLRGQGEEQHPGEVGEVEELSDEEELHVRSGQKLDAH